MTTTTQMFDGRPVVGSAAAKGRCHRVMIVRYGQCAYRVLVQKTNYQTGRDVTSWFVSSGPSTVDYQAALKLFARTRK